MINYACYRLSKQECAYKSVVDEVKIKKSKTIGWFYQNHGEKGGGGLVWHSSDPENLLGWVKATDTGVNRYSLMEVPITQMLQQYSRKSCQHYTVVDEARRVVSLTYWPQYPQVCVICSDLCTYQSKFELGTPQENIQHTLPIFRWSCKNTCNNYDLAYVRNNQSLNSIH